MIIITVIVIIIVTVLIIILKRKQRVPAELYESIEDLKLYETIEKLINLPPLVPVRSGVGTRASTKINPETLNHNFDSVGATEATDARQQGQGGGYEDTQRDGCEDMDEDMETVMNDVIFPTAQNPPTQSEDIVTVMNDAYDTAIATTQPGDEPIHSEDIVTVMNEAYASNKAMAGTELSQLGTMIYENENDSHVMQHQLIVVEYENTRGRPTVGSLKELPSYENVAKARPVGDVKTAEQGNGVE